MFKTKSCIITARILSNMAIYRVNKDLQEGSWNSIDNLLKNILSNLLAGMVHHTLINDRKSSTTANKSCARIKSESWIFPEKNLPTQMHTFGRKAPLLMLSSRICALLALIEGWVEFKYLHSHPRSRRGNRWNPLSRRELFKR